MTALKTRQAHILFIVALMLCEVAAAFETSMIFAAMANLVAEFGDQVVDGLGGYTVERKPAEIPPARSVEIAAQAVQEVFPDHDSNEAMAVVRKTAQ